MNEAEAARMTTKWQMLVDRGGEHYATCDVCGRHKPSQMHEMIFRSSTFRHSTARELTYRKELCALLCVNCHHEIHHGAGVDERLLWQKLYRLYGYEAVVQAFDEVEETMKTTLGIILPEEEL